MQISILLSTRSTEPVADSSMEAIDRRSLMSHGMLEAERVSRTIQYFQKVDAEVAFGVFIRLSRRRREINDRAGINVRGDGNAPLFRERSKTVSGKAAMFG